MINIINLKKIKIIILLFLFKIQYNFDSIKNIKDENKIFKITLHECSNFSDLCLNNLNCNCPNNDNNIINNKLKNLKKEKLKEEIIEESEDITEKNFNNKSIENYLKNNNKINKNNLKFIKKKNNNNNIKKINRNEILKNIFQKIKKDLSFLIKK